MEKNFTINKEYSNNRKNISVTFNSLSEIKESQLKMIVNNDINCLLATKFMRTEDKSCLYYDYENMVTFAELFSNRKMSISDIVVFFKSFLYMIDELEGYLLSSKGILLDYNYIFYDNSAEDYRYIHIPTENEDFSDNEILNFFGQTVRNYYDNLNDNFSIEILDTVSRNRNIDEIRKIISKYDSKSILGKIKNNIRENTYDDFQDEMDTNETPNDIPSFYKNSDNFNSAIPQKPKVTKKEKGKPKAKQQTKQANKNNKSEKTNGKKSSSTKITVFIGVQVLAIAIIAKVAMADIEQEQLIALVVAFVVIDLIVAKELFLKNANKGQNVKEKKAKERKVKEKKVKDKVTGKQNVQFNPQTVPNNNIPQNVPQRNFNKEVPPKDILDLKKEVPHIQTREEQKPIDREIPRKEIPIETKKTEVKQNPPIEEKPLIIEEDDDKFERTVLMPIEQEDEIEDIEMEKTVLMNQNVPLGYIEVYDKENNITNKFIITKEKTIIGRLKSQVDLQIKDLMIGKIHAEIVLKENNIFVRDICSLNGVYIGESRKKIKQDTEIAINSGETLYLADTKIRVYSM